MNTQLTSKAVTPESSPFDIQGSKAKSRQALRAENRQAAKDLKRHTNEVIGKKNQSRTTHALPLNRAGRRKFVSNRCDPAFRVSVAKFMAEMA